jgi:DNA-binding response OmpR family regulator
MDRLLLVEDEVDLNNLLAEQLRRDGYRVAQAFDGPSALAEFEREPPHLVILDWMMPGMDGLAVLQRIRARHLVPVLMLTARGQDMDVVNGLDAGADDYLAKPAHMRVLRARIKALLRRSSSAPTIDDGPAASRRAMLGDIDVDPASHLATRANVALELTPIEFDLLALFVTHPGRAFSRDYLLERIWPGDSDVGHRTVDTHVQRLRKKLGDGDSTLQTVWGMGYRMAAPAP